MNTAAMNALVLLKAPIAYYCFYCFMTGAGGDKPGVENRPEKRRYVDLYSMVNNEFGLFFGNSINEYYKENMKKAFIASKSVLNKQNNEIYIATSPNVEWDGAKYLTDYSCGEITETAFNMQAMGTFNRSPATVVLHCTYNAATNTYYMEYIYYLTDYYNFDIADIYEEQNMLGLAKSYELFGKLTGTAIMSEKVDAYFDFPSIFEM